ncbi:beta-galactosidase [Anaeromassilibacillus senegalensis]|uniref:Beta-galactosidase n=2 Tax=Anaeromassilibacillus senegalensis TaxID=1673717 RepID=A0ABS9CL08_9FIRM|nr:beta-galactosidase [Anaeromassilibacillus senegalensis]
MVQIPRKEYPRPQFERENWLNLNGEWAFEMDNGRSGEARGLYQEGAALADKILVPFCPESELSGIGHKDFMYGVWYKRTVSLTEAQLSGRVILHFGAVDYHCKAYVNGVLAGEHKGGYVSFAFDVTALLRPGANEITVYAEDNTRDRLIPSGKQSHEFKSFGCFYTRTTGIWQTVWMEFLPTEHIERVKYHPNIADGSVTVEAALCGTGDFKAEIFFADEKMGEYTAENADGTLHFTVALKEKHLWEVGCGNLYDVRFTFGADKVKSYFGLREVRLDGHKFLINGKSVFQRLVLDQGFYPDGIYTAPSDEALENDIKLSLAVGFNGARLHEKIFEERFLYHADRLGYIVWGEFPNWGLDPSYADSIYGILPEWVEELQRDFNHPAIVGWCPYNETWDQDGRKQFDDALALVYQVTKAFDPTRPCIDTSGNFHVATDIFCVHDYEQDPDIFKDHYDKLMTEGKLFDNHEKRQTYRGEATFVSEYGGIAWSQDESGWGYGNGPKTGEEFIDRFRRLTDALLDNREMFGLCYTQLTDVEQEQNGLYTYGRKPKFDPEIFRKILSRKAAIED